MEPITATNITTAADRKAQKADKSPLHDITVYGWVPEKELLMACKSDPKVDLIGVISEIIGRKNADKYYNQELLRDIETLRKITEPQLETTLRCSSYVGSASKTKRSTTE